MAHAAAAHAAAHAAAAHVAAAHAAGPAPLKFSWNFTHEGEAVA